MTTETTHLPVDLGSDGYTDLFRAAPVYRKSAVVTIRTATPGEVVATVMADGTEETTVTCAGGEPVITNPGGEQYVPMGGWEQVGRRYSALGNGRYEAKGMVRAFRNPTGLPVIITAPWGEVQRQGADCLFAVEYRPDVPDRIGTDRYLIGGAEFAETYEPAGQGQAPAAMEIDVHRRYAVIKQGGNVLGVIAESFPGDGLVLFGTEQEWREASGQ